MIHVFAFFNISKIFVIFSFGRTVSYSVTITIGYRPFFSETNSKNEESNSSAIFIILAAMLTKKRKRREYEGGRLLVF